jgi:flagellar motor switch protein FliN/FliY
MSKTSPKAEPDAPDEQLDRAIEELRGVLKEEERRSGAASDAGAGTGAADGASDSVIMNIPVEVQIVLGSAEMPVSELMALQKGSTVALDRRIGEPVDIVVNGRHIARGEITVLESDPSRFGVRLTEVIAASRSR